MTTIYWLEDPKILFDKNYLTELWPTPNMTYTEKMNTLCRLVIILTILGLLLFRKMSILIIGLAVLCVLTYVYNRKILNGNGVNMYTETEYEKKTKNIQDSKKENYTNMLPWKGNELSINKKEYVDNRNPLENHLLSDSVGAEKKIKKNNNIEINNDALMDTVRTNSELKNNIIITNDLENNFSLDRSVRNFYKTPDYDKNTIMFLTGGDSATVKDNIFINKNEKFIQ
tara:strand:+ start:22786 stop:23469 length:684 start_codon:yes stop_codon:yes gene_type:complete